jgi:ADP-heptose:LPS heptosyltransferase
LEDISANHLAEELLAHCLNGTPWPQELLDHLLEGERSQALFRIVVERLADLFEPRLCDVYAEIFSEAIARAIPGLHADHLQARYQRIRRPRRFDQDASQIRNVFVLSRVTLGADIAVTSVMLDAAKRKFPRASICYAGPQKGWEMFAKDPRLTHALIPYSRGSTLADRLSIWPALRETLCVSDSIVIDPDSRLTQLGLLPVCREEDYFFFESRSYGGSGDDPLPALAARWALETFDVEDARPYIAPALALEDAVEITVSIGVGENAAKRVEDPFEPELLRHLAARGRRILIDKGAGGEEAKRVERAINASGNAIETWTGSFAGFASHIARSRLFIGYDSAAGHAAAACGVPMVCVFNGAVSERMYQRWRPTGAGPIEIVRATDPAETLRATIAAMARLG